MTPTHLSRIRQISIYLCLAAVAVVCTLPLADTSKWPKTHDGLRYHHLVDHFQDAFEHGVVYPRHLPHAGGGYGYPTFVFYQPAFFYLCLPFSFMFENTLTVVYFAILLLFFLGAVGAYKMCAEIGGKIAGLACGVMFVMTPYAHVNLLVRGDLGELMAMLLCPWPIYWLIRLRNSVAENQSNVGLTFCLGLGLACVILSHPATTMFFVPAFVAVAGGLVLSLQSARRIFLTHATMALLLGVAVSSPYWLTLFQMKQYVAHESAFAEYFLPDKHLVYVRQLFSTYWGFGFSESGPQDGVSFQLGLPHFLAAVAGAFVLFKNRMIQASFGVYTLLILLMLPSAAWVWNTMPFLHYAQFPWRILSVTATFQVLCMAGLYRLPQKFRWATPCLWSSLVVFSCYWYSDIIQQKPLIIDNADTLTARHLPESHHAFHTYAARNEFTPHSATKIMEAGPRGDRSIVSVIGDRQAHASAAHTPHHIRFQIDAGPQSLVRIEQIFLPGWTVKLDGTPLSEEQLRQSLSYDGRIQVYLHAGDSHMIEAYYEGPPGWRWRDVGIGVFLAVFGLFCFSSEYRRKAQLAVFESESRTFQTAKVWGST